MANEIRNEMAVEMLPKVWELSCSKNNWRLLVTRSPATDAVLHRGERAALVTTADVVQTTLETRTGPRSYNRVDVVGRRVETELGTLIITDDMIVI